MTSQSTKEFLLNHVDLLNSCPLMDPSIHPSFEQTLPEQDTGQEASGKNSADPEYLWAPPAHILALVSGQS